MATLEEVDKLIGDAKNAAAVFLAKAKKQFGEGNISDLLSSHSVEKFSALSRSIDFTSIDDQSFDVIKKNIEDILAFVTVFSEFIEITVDLIKESTESDCCKVIQIIKKAKDENEDVFEVVSLWFQPRLFSRLTSLLIEQEDKLSEEDKKFFNNLLTNMSKIKYFSKNFTGTLEEKRLTDFVQEINSYKDLQSDDSSGRVELIISDSCRKLDSVKKEWRNFFLKPLEIFKKQEKIKNDAIEALKEILKQIEANKTQSGGKSKKSVRFSDENKTCEYEIEEENSNDSLNDENKNTDNEQPDVDSEDSKALEEFFSETKKIESKIESLQNPESFKKKNKNAPVNSQNLDLPELVPAVDEIMDLAKSSSDEINLLKQLSQKLKQLLDHEKTHFGLLAKAEKRNEERTKNWNLLSKDSEFLENLAELLNSVNQNALSEEEMRPFRVLKGGFFRRNEAFSAFEQKLKKTRKSQEFIENYQSCADTVIDYRRRFSFLTLFQTTARKTLDALDTVQKNTKGFFSCGFSFFSCCSRDSAKRSFSELPREENTFRGNSESRV